MSNNHQNDKSSVVNRRGFLKLSGTAAVVAGGIVGGCGGAVLSSGAGKPTSIAPDVEAVTPVEEDSPAQSTPGIKQYRVLGRTGFEVSDISMGGSLSDSNVLRYAYDRGVNLVDTAEVYGNGDSERKIGMALPEMDRKKIFVVTKLILRPDDTEQTLFDRFTKCQERLDTEYVDALYIHNATLVKEVSHEAFHQTATRLKRDGRLRFIGISSHGPSDPQHDSMEKVLLSAVEDGRFDLMLMTYNFLNAQEGGRVLNACKEKNIGTVCMKAAAGRIEIDSFDPENPTEDQRRLLDKYTKRGMTRDKAIEIIQKRVDHATAQWEKDNPAVRTFMSKYGVDDQRSLDRASRQWVLQNSDMHTLCVTMPDFDSIDATLPLSGIGISPRQAAMLDDYRRVFGGRYCRHGCTMCAHLCPKGVRVSTVMRYFYYFHNQGRERMAMEKYARLDQRNAESCWDCDAPCLAGCPYNFQIQASLTKAHNTLSFA